MHAHRVVTYYFDCSTLAHAWPCCRHWPISRKIGQVLVIAQQPVVLATDPGSALRTGSLDHGTPAVTYVIRVPVRTSEPPPSTGEVPHVHGLVDVTPLNLGQTSLLPT